MEAKTLYSPGVRAIFARFYPPGTIEQLRVVAEEQDRVYRAGGGGVTHGWMAWQLAVGLGLPVELAEGAGHVLDALQPAIDLADNIADVELDRSLGRDPDVRYPGVPADARPFLPALILAACVAEVHRAFPAPRWNAGEACASMLGVLARMNLAQGLPLDHPDRNDGLSGEVGRLWLLPFWLLPEGHAARRRLPALDAWVFQFARTIQLGWDVVEHPGEPHRRERLEATRAEARAAWPRFGPFRRGQVFDREDLLRWPP